MMNRPPTIFVVLMALIITVSFNIPQVNINPVTTYNSYINSNNINNNHYSNANNHFTCNLPSAASGNTNVNINMIKPAQPSFDYYTLAQQWPPGVCKKQPSKKQASKKQPSKKQASKKQPSKCKRIPKRFTVHGLWPSNTVQKHPRECIKPSSFDFGKIQGISSQLSIDWPNLIGVNKKFWKAQWDKHGSCSQFKQSYYFQYAMNLRAMDNLTSILEVEGITPGGSYHQHAIITAIVKKLGVIPTLTCVGNNILAEIHLCFNPTTPTYENCPSHYQTCTTAPVFFEA